MMQKVNKLVKAVDTHQSDEFNDVFYLLMILVPWYPGWQQQKAARRAQARFNGALAKNAKLAGAYIIGHYGIQAPQGEELYEPQDPVTLSIVGIHLYG